MNIYQISVNVFEFNLFNCLKPEIDGHATIVYNCKTKKFKVIKFGEFGGLTWYPKIKKKELNLSEETIRYIRKWIQMQVLPYAVFYSDKKPLDSK